MMNLITHNCLVYSHDHLWLDDKKDHMIPGGNTCAVVSHLVLFLSSDLNASRDRCST